MLNEAKCVNEILLMVMLINIVLIFTNLLRTYSILSQSLQDICTISQNPDYVPRVTALQLLKDMERDLKTLKNIRNIRILKKHNTQETIQIYNGLIY